MTLIIVFFILHAVALCYLAYTSRISKVIKSVLLSFLVITGAFALDFYKDRLGAPIEGYPPKFIYVHHRIVSDNIELWVDFEEAEPRLYVFPYSQEAAEELQKAKEKSEGGTPQTGEFESQTGTLEGPQAPVMDDWHGDKDDFSKGGGQ